MSSYLTILIPHVGKPTSASLANTNMLDAHPPKSPKQFLIKFQPVINGLRRRRSTCVSYESPNCLLLLNAFNDFTIFLPQVGINQIFLENGIHDEEGEVVEIDFALTIIGESKDGCKIVGGLWVTGNKEDDVNVKNLTISPEPLQSVQPVDLPFELQQLLPRQVPEEH